MVPVGAQVDAPHEFAVADFVIRRLFAEIFGEIVALQFHPEFQEAADRFDQRSGLCPEDDGELADGAARYLVQFHFVLDRGPVLVFQAALEEHGAVVLAHEGYDHAFAVHGIFDVFEDVADALFGRGHGQIFGQDLVHEVGPVRAPEEREAVNFLHHIIHQHQTV